MEDYDTVFTIEHLTDKGWQVVTTSNDLTTAINEYRRLLLSDYAAYRLTSPTDLLATYDM